MKTDNVKIGPVTVEDFKTMEIDWTNHIETGIPDYWERVLQYAVTVGMWVEDRLVVILGMAQDAVGVCTVFVISSIYVQSMAVKRLMLRYYDIGLRLLTSVLKPHRLQAIVLPSNRRHVKFIEHFGFNWEGCLRDYTPTGQDVFVYGKSLRAR